MYDNTYEIHQIVPRLPCDLDHDLQVETNKVNSLLMLQLQVFYKNNGTCIYTVR